MEYLLVFMTNQKKRAGDQNAKKKVTEQLDFVTECFLFCVNFIPKIQAGVLINLFLKTGIIIKRYINSSCNLNQ